MPEYTLHYFNIRGYAELARWILTYGDANWSDKRIAFDGPGSHPVPEDIKSRSPYGQVPLLEVDGEILAQSGTIYRFLAREFKLTGKNNFEAAKADEIAEACKDMTNLFLPVFREQDKAKQAEGFKEAYKQAKEKFLNKFNDYAAATGGYLVGKDLTWADFAVVCTLDMYQRFVGSAELTEGLPALAALVKKVKEIPSIKQWLADRPETEF